MILIPGTTDNTTIHRNNNDNTIIVVTIRVDSGLGASGSIKVQV